MRYTTEFKIQMDVVVMDKNIDRRIEYEKTNGNARLGNMIGEKIGWEEKPDEGKHFKLEVQCLPWEVWVDLKSKINDLVPFAYAQALNQLFLDAENKKT